MGILSLVAVLDDPSYSYLTGITDFEIFESEGRIVLYSASVSDNGLSAFELTSGGIASFIEQTSLPVRTTLAPLDLAVVSLESGTALWVEPWLQTGFRSYALGNSGEIGSVTQYAGFSELESGVVHATTLADGAGGAWVFGGLFNSTGLVRLALNGSGSLTDAQHVSGTGTEDVAALLNAELGGNDFLFTARMTQAAVTSWKIDGNGNLEESDSIGVAQGLGIATPTALEVVDFAGETFILLSSAGSSSLTVIAVDDDGAMELRDHVVDSLNTRFAGVEALAVVNHQGRIYIAAGGSDDGISLLQLLPGGQLLHLETLADSNFTTLNNVAAIEAISIGNEIQFLISSGNELGITQFSFRPELGGIVKTSVRSGSVGTDHADILKGDRGDVNINGHGGDDILMDGTGCDKLTGGAGADIFVFTRDDKTDRIADFDVSEDQIDLSSYTMLRDVSQIEITATTNGARLTYHDEELVIVTSNGQPLTAADFSNSSLLQLTHALPMNGLVNSVTLTGNGQDDNLSGGKGEDILTGLGGDDTLSGGARSDILRGGSGADIMHGGKGNDLMEGGRGADILNGNGGDDRLDAGRGDDILKGGDGADVLDGGRHNDKLKGQVGNDYLKGGDGADLLEGGSGKDILYGGEGADHLRGGKDNDTLRGGKGSDLLVGGKGNDTLTGNSGADLFHFNVGKDKITDFKLSEDRLQLDSDLWSQNLTSAEVIAQFATTNGTDTLLKFGSGVWVKLLGVDDPASLIELIDIL